MMDYKNALRFTRNMKDLEIASEFLTDEKLCIGVSRNKPDLYDEVNEVMNRFLMDGTVDEATEHWIRPDGSDYLVTEQPRLPDAPKITVAIVSSREPKQPMPWEWPVRAGLCLSGRMRPDITLWLRF